MSGLLIDVGGSAVKVTAACLEDGQQLAVSEQPLPTQHPDAFTVEADPREWWGLIRQAIDQASAAAGAGGQPPTAVTVASLRQGYVLVDGHGELGPIVLNSDRRGRHELERLAAEISSNRLYDMTGHWLAPELTLPKLMHTAATDPDLWNATTHVLSVHDWVVWRLCGARVAARTVAGSSQLIDVRTRSWATDLLEEVGLGSDRLPPLADAGDEVGRVVLTGLGDPGSSARVASGTAARVIVGGGDTHIAGLGVGAAVPGTAVVVAGSSTPAQATTERPPKDPLRHPWVGPHLRAGRWAVETNAGYPGTAFAWLARLVGIDTGQLAESAWTADPGAEGVTAVVGTPEWSEAVWAHRPANVITGFLSGHDVGVVARAVLESHAYAIRGTVQDLERACETTGLRVVLTGGAASDPRFGQLVADVLERPVNRIVGSNAAARACAQVCGANPAPPPGDDVQPQADDRLREGYQRFLDTFASQAASASQESSASPPFHLSES